MTGSWWAPRNAVAALSELAALASARAWYERRRARLFWKRAAQQWRELRRDISGLPRWLHWLVHQSTAYRRARYEHLLRREVREYNTRLRLTNIDIDRRMQELKLQIEAHKQRELHLIRGGQL